MGKVFCSFESQPCVSAGDYYCLFLRKLWNADGRLGNPIPRDAPTEKEAAGCEEGGNAADDRGCQHHTRSSQVRIRMRSLSAIHAGQSKLPYVDLR